MFLTFLIITYRRPSKLVRLLRVFLDECWNNLDKSDFEILIADDHSLDETLEVIVPTISALKRSGWQVRYVCRSHNVRADRNLYYGYTLDSRGTYVWFLCDDDLLIPFEALNFINAIRRYRPLVGICGFLQGQNGKYGNFLGERTYVEFDLLNSFNLLIKFPKTTAYILRRDESFKLDEIFSALDFSLYSWIGISIYLLGLGVPGGLLVYPPITATADQEYGTLSYSYRVFANLYNVVKHSINASGLNFALYFPQLHNLKDEDELSLCIQGLASHYSRRSHVTYAPTVLAAEWRYLRRLLPSIPASPSRTFLAFKLILFCLIDSAASLRMSSRSLLLMTKRLLVSIHTFLSSQMGIDLRRLSRSVAGIPYFVSDLLRFRALYRGPLTLAPCLNDRFEPAGTANNEYFLQDLIVAQKISRHSPLRHIDIGSRVDGFVSHVASFRNIEVLDIRPLKASIPEIVFRQVDLMDRQSLISYINKHGCADSISCLHALEHFGLGRYGDPLSVEGYRHGLRNISELLMPHGLLYLSVPLGVPRVEFNANWIFDPRLIIEEARCNLLSLEKLVLINPDGTIAEPLVTESLFDHISRSVYTLGLFILRKSPADPR